MLAYYPLQALNSFRVPAWARYYVPCHTLKDITDFCTAVDCSTTLLHILGGGTNTLFVGDFPGYLLHIHLVGIEVVKETTHAVWIKAAAGVNWHEFVLYCVARGYGGIENLSFIPGTVGAAPIQNIGAYGVELKEVLYNIEAIELATGKKRIFNSSSVFGYRTSIFKEELRNRYVVTAVVLLLHKSAKFHTTYSGLQDALEEMAIHKLSFQAISDAVIAIRKKKLPDPAALGNAGSFFKNPFIPIDQYKDLKAQHPLLIGLPTAQEGMIKISAASLIELAGFKGYRIGQVGVYPLHALILVHYGGATGKEILDLSTQIKQAVAQRFQIALLPEVDIVVP